LFEPMFSTLLRLFVFSLAASPFHQINPLPHKPACLIFDGPRQWKIAVGISLRFFLRPPFAVLLEQPRHFVLFPLSLIEVMAYLASPRHSFAIPAFILLLSCFPSRSFSHLTGCTTFCSFEPRCYSFLPSFDKLRGRLREERDA